MPSETDQAWMNLLAVIYDEHGEVTPKVGAALSRYRIAVGHEAVTISVGQEEDEHG